MEHSRFDDLIRSLAHARSRRALTRLLGGLGLGSPFAVLGAHGMAAKGKKGKKRRKKHKRSTATSCVPEAAGVTCAGAPCGSVRSNTCGQAVNCGCPLGFNCLPNGTCARPCTGHSGDCVGCGTGVFCTSANTEGLQHCVVESRCADHPVCTLATSECPRGTQCQECGIGEGNRCIPIAPCFGA
jgi:hypothetical protein